MWSPHCWQYAKPIGVAVPHRGHVIVRSPEGALGVPGIGTLWGGTLGGIVGGRSACELGRGTDAIGIGIGPPGIPYSGGGGACGGDAIGPDGASMPGCDAFWSALPQLRQNFMLGGFSPRHTPQTLGVGNPWGRAGVCPNAGANELPQLRQNDDPGGLSWPHIEQRIGPLTLKPQRACSNTRVTGMASGRFALSAVSW